MGYYPIFLDLRGKPCVVIGGGREAERKTYELLDAGAAITIVADISSPVFAELSSSNRIRWERRAYRDGDLVGAFLALSATTSDRELSELIATEASREHVLLNIVDVTDLCSWIYPAIVRRGDATVAISTNGRSPAMARFLKSRVEEALPAEFGVLLDIVASVRQEVRGSGNRPAPEAWQEVFDEETLALLSVHDWDAIRRRLRASLIPASLSDSVEDSSD